MRILLKILTVIYVIVALLLSIWFGRNLNVSISLHYLETLTTIAAIILGIMGVWLSLIWSDRGKSRKENISYVKNSIILATMVIICSLLFKLLYPIFLQIPIFFTPAILKITRVLSCFLSWIFTLFIIEALFYVVFSFDFFTFDDEIQEILNNSKKKVENKFLSLTQKDIDQE
ncbi:MAG: hypothetical protein HDR34_03335 [Treponema sp.]|nr:hypothetical protein [Treponema sp.]